MKNTLPVLLLTITTASQAGETRQLDAHEHGVGNLNIAVDGTTVAMEFHAPGADIVGFEYEAKSAEDRAKIDEAVALLARASDLFVLPAAAGCTVTEAKASLEAEEMHEDDEHDHDAHADGAHDHEDHAEDKHDHEAHDEHADEGGSGHTEFHAEYFLTCQEPTAIDGIEFAYFDTFENARELEVQIVSATGAQAFEVTRETPALDLRNLF